MESLKLEFDELYYADTYQTRFTAMVLTCDPVPDTETITRSSEKDKELRRLWAVELDNTLFYPEGGGQPADKGRLDDANVLDVQRVAGRIIHYCDRSLEIGAPVEGEIDWDRRFDFMQQHSAEHILSGLVKQRFGYDNVGFHINETEMTFDLNGPLTDEQITDLENSANEAVWRNLPIEIQLREEDDQHLPDYRSKLELEGRLRLITVPGYDCCACCGTHLKFTGEIGLIRIINAETYKGGVRLIALCGRRALRDSQNRWRQSRDIGALLSAPSTDLLGAVRRLVDLLKIEQDKSLSLQKKINLAALDAIPESTGNLYVMLDDDDVNNAKYLAKKIGERVSGAALVFFPHPRQEGYMYIIVSEKTDITEVHQRLRDQLKAKGGGNRGMAQGITTATFEEVRRLCDTFAYRMKI